MFRKGLFSKRRGGANNDDEEDASEHVLPQHAVTSSFVTGCGGEDFSLEGYSFGQLSPDPVISPSTHRAPLSNYARSLLRNSGTNLMDKAGGAGIEDGHFDDLSSMNDDSLYFGAADVVAMAGFSSPVRAENLLYRHDSPPGEPTFLYDNDTDIQTVATGHAFSTVISPSTRSEMQQSDHGIDSTVQRVVGTVKTTSSPTSGSDGTATVDETPGNSPREKPSTDLAPETAETGFFARLRRGPLWLRIVFFGSFLLFVAAILLAVIGLMVNAGRANGASANSNNAIQASTSNQDGTFGPNHVPAGGVSPDNPKADEPPIMSDTPQAEEPPKVSKTDDAATTVPTLSPVMASSLFATTLPKTKGFETTVPVAAPLRTFAPVLVSLEETPGTVAAPAPTSTNTTIYLTAGFLTSEMTTQAGVLLPQLPGTVDDTFLVHLGDWNNLSIDPICAQSSFQTIADFYSASSVPVYWTVGDNEYNDCSDPSAALQLWKRTFVGYETLHWQEPPWTIYRQGELSARYASFSENVAFSHGQVAFLTLNLVGSKTHDEAEFEMRLLANLDWVNFVYGVYKNSVTSIVIFAHAAPDNENSFNKNFYDELFAAMTDTYYDMTFVLVNRGTEKFGFKENYEGMVNLYWISVPGPLFPPLKLVMSEGLPTIVADAWAAF